MRAVDRILAVFEIFTRERSSLSLQEIADGIGLPKSTAFRIVQSLEQTGYLVRLEDQQYCLSFRFTRLAGFVRSTLGIRDIARPVMAELAARTKETVSIHTVVGKNRVCIDATVTFDAPLRSIVQPGEQVPLLAGSASKMLMAYMPPKDVAEFVALIARSTGRKRKEVMDELAHIKQQGYAISHGERLLGVSAISAPIRDLNEESRYCLSVGGPSIRIQLNERELIAMTIAGAANISIHFGAIRTALDS